VKVVLAGNPNVGKRAVFNRLTGAGAIASNYPGTTVEFTRGTMRHGRPAEAVAAESLRRGPSCDLVLNLRQRGLQLLDMGVEPGRRNLGSHRRRRRFFAERPLDSC
jgi:ribosome-binding ATPase YchF (GTP1/OBG family)